MAQPPSIAVTVATSLALVDQFLASLDGSSTLEQQEQPTTHPSPLHLLAASAASLKSTTTKVSLLTITTPFTPSAVTSTLLPLNNSILPSLITATLLTSPTLYPSSFCKECTVLARAALRNLKVLLFLVKTRSEDGQPKKDIADANKRSITEATGKIWEECDFITQFAKGGLNGYVCKKAGQWLDLMKDAVKEFEEWDPEEDVGDDPFGLEDDAHSNDGDDSGSQAEKDVDRAAMSAGVKEQALKVLSRIPQSVHVVVKQRLEKMPKEVPSGPDTPVTPVPAARKKTIEKILKKTRQISDCIDESAEAMYMGNPEQCLKKAGEARSLTIDIVEAVLDPWEKSDQESKEDLYIKRALAWIQQVNAEVQPSSNNNDVKGKENA